MTRAPRMMYKPRNMDRPTNPNRSPFGAWLRGKRLERGVTLRRLALAAHVDPGNLSRSERGLTGVSPVVLGRIGRALHLSSKELSEGRDLAAASAGAVPVDLARERRLVDLMPLIWRGARRDLPRLVATIERLVRQGKL